MTVTLLLRAAPTPQACESHKPRNLAKSVTVE